MIKPTLLATVVSLTYLSSVQANVFGPAIRRNIRPTQRWASQAVASRTYHDLRDPEDWPDVSDLVPGMGRRRRRRPWATRMENEKHFTSRAEQLHSLVDPSPFIAKRYSSGPTDTAVKKIKPATENENKKDELHHNADGPAASQLHSLVDPSSTMIQFMKRSSAPDLRTKKTTTSKTEDDNSKH